MSQGVGNRMNKPTREQAEGAVRTLLAYTGEDWPAVVRQAALIGCFVVTLGVALFACAP